MRKTSRGKRLLSAAMALILAVSMIPFTKVAASTENTEEDLLAFSNSFAQLLDDTYGLEGPVPEVSFLNNNEENPFQTARLIVKSKNEVDPLNAVGVVSGYDDLHILQFASAIDAYDAFEVYEQTEGIEYVQPDAIYDLDPVEQPTAESGDGTVMTASTPNNYMSWGYSSYNMKMDAYHEFLDSWCVTHLQPEASPDDVVVAVLDTGVSADHEFLSGRVLNNGWDFVENDPTPQDEHNHGTHVAGTIVDGTYRWDHVKILPVRVLNANGRGSSINIALGIRYAAEQGADVINMSLGGTGTNYLEQEAINAAVAMGTTVVVAAGNEDTDAGNKSPACLDNVITVAAVDYSLHRCYFSNYGDVVDISAPGDYIESCIPPDANPGYPYAEMSGTSMATPHIAAAAALLLTVHPEYSPAQVELRLKEAATIKVYQCNDDGIDIPNMLSMESLVDPEENEGTVSISRESATCFVGQELQLEAVNSGSDISLVWSSSDEKTASVSSGTVTCLKAGTVTITAYDTADDTNCATCEITIVAAPTITPAEDFILPLNGTKHISFSTDCDPVPAMTWSIDNDDAAYLFEYYDANGDSVQKDLVSTSGIYIRGRQTGSVTLTATILKADGTAAASASCEVTVEDNSWYDEKQSEYIIEDEENLLQMTRAINAGIIGDYMEGKTVKLAKSLDLSDTNFTPITSFYGTFDGQGNTLTISMTDVTGNNDALFGYLSPNALVKDLNLNVTITSTETMERINMGGIAAENEGAIESCTVSGNISADNRQYVGGIAGYNLGTITECTNNARINGSREVGGIAGCNEGTVIGCYNTAAVQGGHYVGGIVGNSLNLIADCVNSGTVQSTEVTRPKTDGMYIGGIAGYSDWRIIDCENRGNVSGETHVGGICGMLIAANMQNCHNSGSVSGSLNYTGGICGYSIYSSYDYGDGSQITDCTNSGPVSGRGIVGGICGSSPFDLFNCVNTASVTWVGVTDRLNYAGGICGSGSAYNCINLGSVSATGSVSSKNLYVGGISGDAYSIENCLNAGSVSAPSGTYVYTGSICGEGNSYGSIKNCYYTGSTICGSGSPTVENSSRCSEYCGKYTLDNSVTAGSYTGYDLLEAMNAYVMQEYLNGGVYNEENDCWEREMFELCFWEYQSGALIPAAGVAVKSGKNYVFTDTVAAQAAQTDNAQLIAAYYLTSGKMSAVKLPSIQDSSEGYLLRVDLGTSKPSGELRFFAVDKNWKPFG